MTPYVVVWIWKWQKTFPARFWPAKALPQTKEVSELLLPFPCLLPLLQFQLQSKHPTSLL